jgi:hypothetical protein
MMIICMTFVSRAVRQVTERETYTTDWCDEDVVATKERQECASTGFRDVRTYTKLAFITKSTEKLT